MESEHYYILSRKIRIFWANNLDFHANPLRCAALCGAANALAEIFPVCFAFNKFRCFMRFNSFCCFVRTAESAFLTEPFYSASAHVSSTIAIKRFQTLSLKFCWKLCIFDRISVITLFR